MKETKRRSLILIIITISVFLIVIIGATYAFFATTRDVNNVINANVGTAASMYSFSATSNGNIEMNIAFNEMSQANVSTNVLKTGNATINVSLASPTDDMLTVCTYDIVWVWDSDVKYVSPDLELPYTYIPKPLSNKQIEDYFGGKEEYEEEKQWYIEEYGEEAWKIELETIRNNSDETYYEDYPYEFSTKVDTTAEADLSKLSTSEDGKTITLQSGLSITSTSTISTTKTHTIEANIYNLPVEQTKLFGKSFKAHVTIDNLDCTMTDYTETLAYHVTNTVYNSDNNQINIGKGAAGLYLHDSYLENGAEDNSYRYAGGYNYLKASDGFDTHNSIIVDDDCYEECDGMCYVLTYDETSQKYSYDNALKKAIEDGYIEEAINNYVCFEGDDCSDENNLYRIISVDDMTKQIKIIKATPSTANMLWYIDDTFEYNQVERYLNSKEASFTYYDENHNSYQIEGYLHSLGIKEKKIVETDWTYGDMYYVIFPNTVKDAYEGEKEFEYLKTSKIGMIYPSDYGYAALPEYWLTDLREGYVSSIGNDWLLSSFNQWTTINSSDGTSNSAFIVAGYSSDGITGRVYPMYTDVIYNGHGNNYIRPAFNLQANVKILNSEATNVGSKDVPMIIG